MPVDIVVGLSDEQLQAQLAKQKASWEKNEAAADDFGKSAAKAERMAVNHGKNLVKQHRSAEQALKDRVAAVQAAAKSEKVTADQARDTIASLVKKHVDAGKAAKDAARKGTAAYKQQAAEIDRGKRKTQELVESTKSLDEKHDELKASLIAAYKAGETSAEELKVSIAELNRRHKEAGEAAKEAAIKGTDAYKQQAAQVDRGKRKAKELIQSTKSLNTKHRELKASIVSAYKAGEISVDEMKTSIRELNHQHTNLRVKQAETKKGNPFGGSALASITSYGLGVASVGAAIGLVKKAFEQYKQEVQKGRDETIRQRDPRRNLLQVSDETNFGDRLKSVDQAAVKFGVSREKSSGALFDAISNEVEGDFESILRADRVIPADIGAKFVGEFRKSFENETFTADQALNLGLAAAGTSKFNIQEIQPQIRTASQGSALLPGVEASDVAAFVSVLGAKFGDQTGTEVRGLQTSAGAELIKQTAALEALKSAKPGTGSGKQQASLRKARSDVEELRQTEELRAAKAQSRIADRQESLNRAKPKDRAKGERDLSLAKRQADLDSTNAGKRIAAAVAEVSKQESALANPKNQAAEIQKIEKNIALLSGTLPEIISGLSNDTELRSNVIGGNNRVLKTFTVAAASLDKINAVDKTIEKETKLGGTDQDLLSRRLKVFFKNPDLALDVSATKTKIGREISAEDKFSGPAAIREALRDRVNQGLTDQDAGFLKRFLVNRFLDIGEFSSTPENLSSEERVNFAKNIGESQSNEELQKQTALLEKMANQQDNQPLTKPGSDQ